MFHSRPTLLLLAAFVAVIVHSRSTAGDSWPSLELTPLPQTFGRITEIAPAGDGSGWLFVVEQPGIIKVFDPANPDPPVIFLDITGRVRDNGGEQGLLGLAFSRTYATDRTFYVYYTDNAGDIVVSSFTATAPKDAAEDSERVILQVDHPPATNHNGGHLAFGPDGWFYIGTGDGGGGGDPQNRAQNDQDRLGKLLRYNPATGAIETWAKGLRNPWKFSFDRLTGDLYIADVGQNEWEEVNFAPAGAGPGRNYGWRIMEGSHCFSPKTGCSAAGLTLPVTDYSHAEGCSVTGGYVAREPGSGLEGIYFFSDFCSGTIWGLRRDSEGRWEREDLGSAEGNVTTFGEAEDGSLYIAVEAGGITRIHRLGASMPPQALPPLPYSSRLPAIASDR